jgi:hypothetical protein
MYQLSLFNCWLYSFIFIFPFLSYNAQVAYVQRCALWEHQTAATTGERSAGVMYAGKPLGETRREIDNNFIKEFVERAFEIADMWECRIDFKILFY